MPVGLVAEQLDVAVPLLLAKLHDLRDLLQVAPDELRVRPGTSDDGVADARALAADLVSLLHVGEHLLRPARGPASFFFASSAPFSKTQSGSSV